MRLIDADALKESVCGKCMFRGLGCGSCIKDVDCEFGMRLDDAPTITVANDEKEAYKKYAEYYRAEALRWESRCKEITNKVRIMASNIRDISEGKRQC